MQNNDTFSLYNLRVTTEATDKPFVCDHVEGESFQVVGEKLIFDRCQDFSLYALSSLLPLLPAKQRVTDANDWMTTDGFIACPDPHCGARFRIDREGKTTFSHADVTAVPLEG